MERTKSSRNNMPEFTNPPPIPPERIKKADAILTGDWHLRDDVPVCRMDDYMVVQWKKVDFISELQKEHDCMVIHSGDLFNHWKPSPYLLSKTMEHLPKQFNTIYGNHDLPQHNLDLAEKCGTNVLSKSGHLHVLPGTHWNQPVERTIHCYPPHREVLVYHIMTYQAKKPWPGITDPMAATLLRKYPQFDLIVTGHNHKTFVEEHNGRLLVNPGSIFRQTASQIDHKPCVFLWYIDSNTVVPVYLPISEGVISREHIEEVERREGRIDAFIKKLNTDWEASLSFEENLEIFAKANQVEKEVMEIIYKALE